MSHVRELLERMRLTKSLPGLPADWIYKLEPLELVKIVVDDWADDLAEAIAADEADKITHAQAMSMLEKYRVAQNELLATTDPTNDEIVAYQDAVALCLDWMAVLPEGPQS